ncbi:MAG: ABC transporter substrate-binding protein [Planctomycetota bacterium]
MRFLSTNSFILVLIPTILAGCQEAETSLSSARMKKDRGSWNADAPNPSSSVSSQEFPLTIRDSLDRQIKLPREPKRIISIAPKNTELLFAVGAGEQVVGVTSYCNYPPEAQEVDQVGGFSTQSLSIEKIVSLKSDLILAAGSFHDSLIGELERLQIPVVAMGGESISDLFEEIQQVGRITGHARQAERLVRSLRKEIDGVKATAQTIPKKERVTVFYQVWEEPLSAAGPRSCVGELIEICGGVNVFEEESRPYTPISEEVLFDRNPQVILAPRAHDVPVTVESIGQKPGWDQLRAVRNNRIHLIGGDLVSRCGPRVVHALKQIAHALYPSHFEKPDAPPTGRSSSKAKGQAP